MVARPKKQKEVLSATAIDDLRREKAEIEGTIKAIREGTGEGTRAKGAIDVQRLEQEAVNLDKRIAAGSPPRVTGKTKDDLHRQAQELATSIKEGMPTYSEMRDPAKYPGAIQKNRNWEKAKQEKVLKWKQIMRTIEPGDPTVSNVERLRDGR